MTNKWKGIAIIFIVLFVLETLAVIWTMSIGVKEINKETSCRSLCTAEDYGTYFYQNDVCSCYNKEGVVDYAEVIK